MHSPTDYQTDTTFFILQFVFFISVYLIITVPVLIVRMSTGTRYRSGRAWRLWAWLTRSRQPALSDVARSAPSIDDHCRLHLFHWLGVGPIRQMGNRRKGWLCTYMYCSYDVTQNVLFSSAAKIRLGQVGPHYDR